MKPDFEYFRVPGTPDLWELYLVRGDCTVNCKFHSADFLDEQRMWALKDMLWQEAKKGPHE